MKRDKRGFTLAELLVVVAIIAVLVAIAIPIFTSQLEKSREATDAANIRSQYAQVMTDAITDGGNVNGKDTYGAIELKQKKDNWQDTTLGTNLHGLFQEIDGHPVANGTAWVEYKASESKVILHYEGEGSGTGTGGSSSGGSTGESSSGGNTGTSYVNQKLNDVSKEWNKDITNTVEIGEVYIYKGVYYISLSSSTLNSGGTPEPGGWYQYNFVTPTKTVYTSNDVDSNGNISKVNYGDIYSALDGSLYISKASSSPLIAPTNDNNSNSNWVKILLN